MRILGIDPGTRLCGFGCLDLKRGVLADAVAEPAAGLPMAQRVGNLVRPSQGRLRYLESGVLKLGADRVSIPARLARLQEEVGALFARLEPEVLALEEAYFGKSVSAALRMGEARGVILAAASRARVQIEQFAPARIKRVVTGRGAAGKGLVAEMVRKTLSIQGMPESLDETDALAVAMCCAEGLRGFPRQGH